MAIKSLTYILLLSIAVTCFSCRRSEYVAVFDFPTEQWQGDQRIVFRFDPTRHDHLFDIRIFARFRNNIDCNSVTIEIKSHSPKGGYWCDTLSIPTTHNEMYVEREFTNHFEIQVPYRKYSTFADSGSYIFEIRHIDPSHAQIPVQGVMAIGVDIVLSN